MSNQADTEDDGKINKPITQGGARAGAGRKSKNGVRTSIYPSAEVDDLWKGLALKKGVNQVTVYEEAIKRYARAEGLSLAQARALIEAQDAKKTDEA